jgi:hypothetical protein
VVVGLPAVLGADGRVASGDLPAVGAHPDGFALR